MRNSTIEFENIENLAQLGRVERSIAVRRMFRDAVSSVKEIFTKDVDSGEAGTVKPA